MLDVVSPAPYPPGLTLALLAAQALVPAEREGGIVHPNPFDVQLSRTR